MNKSPFLEARGIIVSIGSALLTYSGLIDGEPDDDSLESRQGALNTEGTTVRRQSPV